MHGITEGKYLGLVIGPPMAVILSYPNYFPVIMVQDDKPSSSVALLRATVNLDMNIGSFDKPGTDWKVNWPSQGGFGGLHVVQLVFSVFKMGLHFQFFGRFPGVINHKRGLV